MTKIGTSLALLGLGFIDISLGRQNQELVMRGGYLGKLEFSVGWNSVSRWLFAGWHPPAPV